MDYGTFDAAERETICATANISHTTEPLVPGTLLFGPLEVGLDCRLAALRGAKRPRAEGDAFPVVASRADLLPRLYLEQTQTSAADQPKAELLVGPGTEPGHVCTATEASVSVDAVWSDVAGRTKPVFYATQEGAPLFGVWDGETATSRDKHVAVSVAGKTTIKVDLSHFVQPIYPGDPIGYSRSAGAYVPWEQGYPRVGMALAPPERVAGDTVLQILLQIREHRTQPHPPTSPATLALVDAVDHILGMPAFQACGTQLDVHCRGIPPHEYDAYAAATPNPEVAHEATALAAAIVGADAPGMTAAASALFPLVSTACPADDPLTSLEDLPFGWKRDNVSFATGTLESYNALLYATLALRAWLHSQPM